MQNWTLTLRQVLFYTLQKKKLGSKQEQTAQRELGQEPKVKVM